MNIQSNLKNVQNILDRFPKDEVQLESHELESHQIELGIPQEINALVKSIKAVNSEIKSVEQEVMSKWLDYDEVRNKIEVAKKNLKEAKGEAAFRLKSYDYTKQVKELDSKMKKAAAELGVKPDSIKGYKDLFAANTRNQKQLKELNAAIKKYNV